jgi:hypothetical protein
MEGEALTTEKKARIAPHGWIGALLVAVFWVLNWNLEGLRTYWAFFPLWLGYCLAIDALVLYRTGTSLLTRSWRKYVGLFLISAPVWWLFEVFNARLQNWHYVGSENFPPVEFFLWATLSFTTVIPAVFGAAELFSSFRFIRYMGKGPVIAPTRRTTLGLFVTGWVMLAVMLAWPRIFFPFVWISVYFILAPVNIWLGFKSEADQLQSGDWRPVIALWGGVLFTAFFWEMWNYFSYPKWVYSVAWGGWLHIFEMPLLGYGGYLPFALELYVVYHLFSGIFGKKKDGYVRIGEDIEG